MHPRAAGKRFTITCRRGDWVSGSRTVENNCTTNMLKHTGTVRIPGSGDNKPFDVLSQSPKGSTMFRRMERGIDGSKLK